MLSYYTNIAHNDECTLARKALIVLEKDSSSSGKANWASVLKSLKNTLETTSQNTVTNYNKLFYITTLKNLYTQICFNQFKSNPKLDLYTKVKLIYRFEPYLKITRTKWNRQQQNLCAHSLPIETGRFLNTPRNECTCTYSRTTVHY